MKRIEICFPMLVLFVVVTIVSCHHRAENKEKTVDSTESGIVSDSIESEPDCHYWKNPYPELTWGQLSELVISSIANGDKETFASLVDYPIRRDYPLRDIENQQQMIDNFDLIFDASFRDKLHSMDSNSWEEVGWRGEMLCDGMLWGCPVYVINYSSPKEEQLRKKIIEVEMSALNPSLQGEWEPHDRLLLDDKKYGFARIDYRETGWPLNYRLTIFNKGAMIGDKPALTLYGDCESQGTICYLIYSFDNNEGYTARYEPDKYHEDGEDYGNFKNYVLLTNPIGKTVKLIVEKGRYYQPNPICETGRY